MEKTYKVSELNQNIKNLLESGFSEVAVTGELSFRLTGKASSGHFYFTLKDEISQIKCVMWSYDYVKLSFEPANGDQVTVRGKVTVYTRGGDLQISVKAIEKSGAGDLLEKFKRLKAKLQAEGLFDEMGRKTGARPIPELPQRIGVVTSATGAAIKDILSVLNRRFANIEVLIYNVKVQGNEAAGEIAYAVNELNRHFPDLDVLLVGRGGGSIEDLWSFNEEIVARSIFGSKIPVISCVGHEIDFTLADFVADLRAPTPSAAAEIVVKNKADLYDRMQVITDRMFRTMSHSFELLNHRIEALKNSPMLKKPEAFIENCQQQTDELKTSLDAAITGLCDDYSTRTVLAGEKLILISPVAGKDSKINNLSSMLEEKIKAVLIKAEHRAAKIVAGINLLSPEAVLKRGYSITWDNATDKIVRDASMLKPGAEIRIRFGKGEAGGKILE